MSDVKYSKDDIIAELVKRIMAKEHHKESSIASKTEHPLAHPLSNMLLQINANGDIGIAELESVCARCRRSLIMKLGAEQSARFGVMLSAAETLIADLQGPNPPKLTPVSKGTQTDSVAPRKAVYARTEDLDAIYANVARMRGGDTTSPAPKVRPVETPTRVVSDMIKYETPVVPVAVELSVEKKIKPVAKPKARSKPAPRTESFNGSNDTVAVWAQYEEVWGKINNAAKKAKIHDGCQGLFDYKEPQSALALTMPMTMKRHTEEAKAAIEDPAAHVLLDRLAELHAKYHKLRKASLNTGDALAGSRAGLSRK